MTLVPNLPEDFDAFWNETLEQALNAPLDFERKPGNAYNAPGFIIEIFRFTSVSGISLNGWIAIPKIDNRKSTIENHPSFLWIPPYGRESMLPNAYGTREGFVSMSLNFFGHNAFHQEKYRKERGYFAEGVLDPRTWIFRRMFQDAVLAARILQEQPEVDPHKIGAMGMSQGAGIAIWLGAFAPFIRAVCADMPFMGGMSQRLGQHIYRYPTKELIDFANQAPNGLETIKRTLSYFDTINVATRCAKPTQVSLGEKDPASKPHSVEAIFNALPGRKALKRYPIGHDWYPEMIPNNREWLLEGLK